MPPSNLTYLEMNEIGPLTNETLENMTNCLDYENKKSCARARELLNKHQWMATGNIKNLSFSNENLMSANEWEIEAQVIKKELREIRSKNKTFSKKFN